MPSKARSVGSTEALGAESRVEGGVVVRYGPQRRRVTEGSSSASEKEHARTIPTPGCNSEFYSHVLRLLLLTWYNKK